MRRYTSNSRYLLHTTFIIKTKFEKQNGKHNNLNLNWSNHQNKL